jgi:hypothetical protein
MNSTASVSSSTMPRSPRRPCRPPGGIRMTRF